MGQPASHNICCSVRDKNERLAGNFNGGGIGQFQCADVDIGLDQPRFLAFAPLWHNQGPLVRRLALASEDEVQVYRIKENLVGEEELKSEDVGRAVGGSHGFAQVSLERTLSLGDHVVTGLLFCDEMSSRNLVVAYRPRSTPDGKSVGPYVARIWNLDLLRVELAKQPASESTGWRLSEWFVASLEDHKAPITGLAISPTYLFTADAGGECAIWQKAAGYARRAVARLHAGGIGDLTVDRLFVYSVGVDDCKVSVWSVPDLTPVLSIDASLPVEILAGLSKPDPTVNEIANQVEFSGGPVPPAFCLGVQTQSLCRLSALRLPLSRWAGSQGSARAGKLPKGSIFIAGVLSEDSNVGIGGAGVLMHWMLGEEPTCKTAQIAHNSPIMAMVYGPYDNGPLVTVDACSVCRIWVWASGLVCSQTVEFPRNSLGCSVSVCVEPQFGLYSTFGDSKVVIWRRDPASLGGAL